MNVSASARACASSLPAFSARASASSNRTANASACGARDADSKSAIVTIVSATNGASNRTDRAPVRAPSHGRSYEPQQPYRLLCRDFTVISPRILAILG
eukprot:2521292-Pyramimonas_sp.AAC.1